MWLPTRVRVRTMSSSSILEKTLRITKKDYYLCGIVSFKTKLVYPDLLESPFVT